MAKPPERAGDVTQGRAAAVINRKLAAALWPGELHFSLQAAGYIGARGAELSYPLPLRSGALDSSHSMSRAGNRWTHPRILVRTMEEEFSRFTAPIRIITLLTAAFAISALVLSAIGLYGAVALHTQQRTREFGIRAALGGMPWELMRMVVVQSLTVVLSGIAVGLVLASVIAKAGSGLLLGVNPVDTLTYAAVTSALVSVMLAALWHTDQSAVDR